jgi:NADH dehydrogenase
MASEAAELDVVTGAFGYTGKYIAQLLLARGRKVRTLTGHPDRQNPFGNSVEIAPLNFQDSEMLHRSLQGASTLYNTYWARFEHAQATFARAIENTGRLIDAAARAGVRKIVHLSIANPSEESLLPYYRGKAVVERAILESGLSYAILRPTVIFGSEDILINNIAWLLRRFPVFAMAGTGDYRLQPGFVEDLANLAVSLGRSQGSEILDVVGPEIYTFQALVELIRKAVRSRARLIHVRPSLALFSARFLGPVVGDVILTREEIEALMAGLLVSSQPVRCPTRFSSWLEQNASLLGAKYSSELARHYR